MQNMSHHPHPGYNKENTKDLIVTTHLFVTVTNQNQKIYVFISNSTTWTFAQAYCREHYTDLSVIDNSDENTEVYGTKPSSAQVWIGLYRVPWTWSDKSQSSFTNWLFMKPDNYLGEQHCVCENSQHGWDDDYCSVSYPFICHRGDIQWYKKITLQFTDLIWPCVSFCFATAFLIYCLVSKLKTTVWIQIKTDAEITNPVTETQILQQVEPYFFLKEEKYSTDKQFVYSSSAGCGAEKSGTNWLHSSMEDSCQTANRELTEPQCNFLVWLIPFSTNNMSVYL